MLHGEVLNVNVDEKYKKENGTIDYGNISLLTYMGQEYFISNKKVADRGICLK